MIDVYIKTNGTGCITEINSDIFISDFSERIKIDSGNGDRYAHAQGNYLPKPLTDENGVYRYKYENGAVCERSEDEMAADMPVSDTVPTDRDRIETMESAIMEIAELIAGVI
jgi:hypothetical protein